VTVRLSTVTQPSHRHTNRHIRCDFASPLGSFGAKIFVSNRHTVTVLVGRCSFISTTRSPARRQEQPPARVRKALGMVAANVPHRTAASEFATLERILGLAKAEVASWGGKVYLVYLPDYHRFDRRVLAYSGYVHNNAEIQQRTLAAAKNAGVPVIDLAAVFAADSNPRRYWPKPMSHYGPTGYALVANTVLSAIAQR
jgi:SGNH hydrolase-like domain, acetyltransferase AlgX